jgi:hypothetical protein
VHRQQTVQKTLSAIFAAIGKLKLKINDGGRSPTTKKEVSKMNKKNLTVILILFLLICSLIPTPTVIADGAPSFAGGTGASNDPYQISNWFHLHNIREYMSSDFILLNDLDSTTEGYDEYASDTADGGSGWLPLGDSSTEFTGSFNGDNHTISDLYIERNSAARVGLFGYTDGASISNIGLINVNITGSAFVGGLAGYVSSSSSVNNSYTTGGTVSGNNHVGGLIGYLMDSFLQKSYSISNVISIGCHGYPRIGGLVGYVFRSHVDDCYAGGLVNATGTATNPIGGFTGEHYAHNTNDPMSYINNSYSYTEVIGGATSSGFIGTSSGNVTQNNCFWDTESSGKSGSSADATGLPTSDMQNYNTFNNTGWDIAYTDTDLNDGYPYLAWQNSTSTHTWLIIPVPEERFSPTTVILVEIIISFLVVLILVTLISSLIVLISKFASF